jgi:hypothetical protein
VSRERAWWLRVPAVLLGPTAVFAALRDDSDDDVEARAEPVLALVFLAGIAGVLASSTSGSLLDDVEYDSTLVAVWAFIGGGIYGFAGYFVIGGAVYLAARGLGGLGDYRRARHLVAFAAAPIALSLFVVWPVQLALLGTDVFRRGGDDDGTTGLVFDLLELAFAVWALGLLLLGVRAVHGWTVWRALGVLGLVALFLAAFAYLPSAL